MELNIFNVSEFHYHMPTYFYQCDYCLQGLLGILIGSAALSHAQPYLQSLGVGRVAAYFIWDLIDRVQQILVTVQIVI